MVIYSLLIALAVSFDSFSIGLAYGIKSVKIPQLSLLIINILCVGVFSVSLLMGNLLTYFIPYTIAKIISVIILISLGLWMLIETVLGNIESKRQEKILIKEIRIKPLGIVIDILKEPSSADIDVSGNIDKNEAIFLGIALSLDSLGVGLGASLGNINIICAVGFLAVFNLLFLILGMKIGECYNVIRMEEKVQFLPSIILIVLGILKLLK